MASTMCTLLAVLLIVPAGARTLLKAPPHGEAEPVKSNQVITIPLQKQMVPVRRNNVTVSHKSAYFGTVQLGEAPHTQEFSMLFDTASGQVIVPSSYCESPACRIHRRYHREASPSAVDINVDGSLVKDGDDRDEVTVGFGTGEVTGEFAIEKVCLGATGESGPGASARCAKAVRVVMAVEMSEQPFSTFAFDGVVGLGLSALSLAPQFSFFGIMAAQRQIHKPQFGVYLTGKEDDASEISFGGHNQARLQSPLQWAKVASPELGYWQVRIEAIRVGGKPLDFCKSGKCRAVVDTGTSHFGVPDQLLDGLRQDLTVFHTGNNTGKFDCRQSKGPQLEIDLGGFALTLQPEDYAKPTPFLTAREGKQMTCRPNLMRVGLPTPIGPNLFVLGEPILRKYYTVFDWGVKKVGFAEAAHEEEEVLMLFQVRAVLHRRA